MIKKVFWKKNKKDFTKPLSVLDEYETSILNNLSGKQPKSGFLFGKIAKYKIHIFRILIVSFIVLFIYLIFSFITAPPRYSDAETAVSEKKLEDMMSKAGKFEPRLRSSLELLKEYPRFYKKVVNNIQDIKVKSGVCSYACIYFTYSGRQTMVDLILPDANFSKKTLIFSPKGMGVFNSDSMFASMLIHETDHVEHIESGKLRRASLFLKCNPLINPHISIDSGLASVVHRIDPMEICAQKEQIRFHKASETTSGYEFKNGIFYNFGFFILHIFKVIFQIITSFFKFIFGF